METFLSAKKSGVLPNRRPTMESARSWVLVGCLHNFAQVCALNFTTVTGRLRYIKCYITTMLPPAPTLFMPQRRCRSAEQCRPTLLTWVGGGGGGAVPAGK